MATSLAALAATKPFEDPLAYLPSSTVREYKREQVIYSPDQHSESIYLVLAGKVKVYRIADDGHQILVDIYRTDELFGDSALIGSLKGREKAVALEPDTGIMAWTASEVEELMRRRPQLSIALLQLMANRCIYLGWRIESFSSDKIERRLAQTLIYFSERFGQARDDGAIQMMPFTHELLSQYVGTSRESITYYMNEFRRRGRLAYSRTGIVVYPDAIKQSLRQRSSKAD